MSTNLISGLSSGFDWQSLVDQLIAVEHQRVDTVTAKQTADKKKLAEWQSFNTKLLAFKTAAGNLKKVENFGLYKASLTSDSSTIKAADLLSVSTSATASIGSYSLKVNNIATANKLSSGSFALSSEALGAGYAGDILINGTAISISATDSLLNVRDKINNANSGASPTGVTASLVNYGAGDYRLLLASDATGAAGISLLNGSASDLLTKFGFADTSRTAKNHIVGGDQTDRFSSTSLSIQSLLGLTAAQTAAAGDIVINGQSIGAIDLSTDTLSSLQSKFAAAGLTVSINSETENGLTSYRLMISGAANTYTDKNNILETLGVLKSGVSDVLGVTGSTANTAGGQAITSTTLLKDIDGYTGYQNTDYIHLEGTDSNGSAVSDDTFALSDTATVGDLLGKIRDLFGDVTASIDGSGKLVVVDNTPGASPLALKVAVKNQGGTAEDTLRFDGDNDLGAAITVRKRQLIAGADASVTLDGVTITQSDNTLDDILSGVSLNLLKADTNTTITLNIGRDTDALMTKFNAFVTSYNSVASYIRTQSSYDDTNKAAGGILFADGTLRSVKSDLTSTLLQSVWGVSADFSTMGLIGISVDKVGQLSIDSSKLSGYLTTNFNDIQNLFTVNGTTSTGTLTYIASGTETKEGEFTVHIDTAATRSTSAASDNVSLSGAETLTITQGDVAATVALTAGMSMTQMIAAINSEMATVRTQTLASANPLYADGGQASTITAATKWNSIYDGSGASVGLVNGDRISFSGTNRSGESISGSYTISDVGADSVQGLLSAVETAFDSQVTAAVNASGQIVVTDKTTGSSKLALTLDTTQAHSLNFGTVLAENTGGQKGRYAMEITASADSGNHLVLTQNNYGTGNGFVIHQQNNLLWTGGDQTVDNGVDVAGTINGEAATGSGQTLKGNSGDANVDGLSLKYTGSVGGIDVGTVKLTLGIAELFDRALSGITDSLDGYVTFKQKSIQEEINNYTKQIEEMEARLARKKEVMTTKYVAMEVAMQKIQNQSSWLTSQVAAASKGWYTSAS